MTTAFAALLIGVAGAALLLALGGYLWVNRTPSTDERFDRYGRVPLFGVNLGEAPTPIDTGRSAADVLDEDEDSEELSTPPVRASREVVVEQGASPAETSSLDATNVESTNADRSRFAPPVADVLKANPSRSNGVAPQRTDDVPPAPRTPTREPRPTRAGWGATPGWPVGPESGLPPTPKYVPTVQPEPPARPFANAASASIANGNGVSAHGAPGSMIEGHQLRFSTPAEGTLQFLPGRLEINTGLDTGREIRFVRVPGPNGTEVTFGRNEGPLYRHIQLRDQTVSREHARLLFAEGVWTLTNLSKTNPVAHNGRILRLAEEQPLSDGDRLEMGEVVFSFRSR